MITETADIFFTVAISPATCRRIFTISSGLVKITWDPPAWRRFTNETQYSFSTWYKMITCPTTTNVKSKYQLNTYTSTSKHFTSKSNISLFIRQLVTDQIIHGQLNSLFRGYTNQLRHQATIQAHDTFMTNHLKTCKALRTNLIKNIKHWKNNILKIIMRKRF